jgi:hypothetical protein
MPGLTGMKGGGQWNPADELLEVNGLRALQRPSGWNKIPGGTVLAVDGITPSQSGIRSGLPNCWRIDAQFFATA